MNIIETEALNFAFPNQKHLTLNNINLSVVEGEFVVLFGKSGSGKTTLLKQLKPQLAPNGIKTGQIKFMGTPLDKLSFRQQSSDIGYVLQNPDNQIVTDKVWHELAFGLESLGYDTATIRLRVAEMASYFGIQHWFHKNVSELSGGQKQLLNLASIMALHPKLLILDEPTSQLDPIAAQDFLETIRKINRDIGTTIILTEHRLQEVLPMADKVMLLDQGELILQGSPRQVGQQLQATCADMFVAMPTPMQICAQISKEMENPPLTVREGRAWLDSLSLTPIESNSSQVTVNNESKKLLKQESTLQSPVIISAKDVWFRYSRNSEDVIKDLQLSIHQGEFFSLVGGNGTGKSTTLSLLSRIHQPYRGKIQIAGKNLDKYSQQELYQGLLGVLPQNPQSLFVKDTVLDDLYEILGGAKNKHQPVYPLKMDKQEVVEGISELTHLTNLWQQHPYDLSGGEQQRLALAKILLLRPKILLLDEPTKGLDDFYKQELGDIVRQLNQQNVTIVMVSHDIEFVAEYADRCGLFFGGNVVSVQPTQEFFSGNSFYTTAANRMSRKYFPNAITIKDVVTCLKKQPIF